MCVSVCDYITANKHILAESYIKVIVKYLSLFFFYSEIDSVFSACTPTSAVSELGLQCSWVLPVSPCLVTLVYKNIYSAIVQKVQTHCCFDSNQTHGVNILNGVSFAFSC